MSDQPNRQYFQLQQAVEVAQAFAKHNVEFMFIGKSGAILLGYPSTTQDVDLFARKDVENGKRMVSALRELQFDIPSEVEQMIVSGADFVQLKSGPFDLDIVFAPDGIDSFTDAKERMHLIGEFPVANLKDIIASKRAAGREKDMIDLPLLEDFQLEFERKMRGEPKTAVELAMEKIDSNRE